MFNQNHKMNLQVRLKSRPVGLPQAQHFELVTQPIEELGVDQVLIRIFYVSVDPAMRGWVNATNNYAQPVKVGDVMKSFAIGRITKSRNPSWKEGDLVTGLFGWQQWAVVHGSVIDRKVNSGMLSGLPLSVTLGVLGLNGVTVYFGLLDIGKPKPGETVIVSSGAGSVGSCVGQIAKIMGCRTVAVSGGPVKSDLAKNYFNFDVSVDYKSGHLLSDIKKACPNGVDIYFDNTSGPISDAVLSILNQRSRVVVCGTVAFENWDPPPLGPRSERQILVTRSKIEGFIAPDFQHRWEDAYVQLAQWLKEGRIKIKEDILYGLEYAPNSIAGLYRGENIGKRVIHVANDD